MLVSLSRVAHLQSRGQARAPSTTYRLKHILDHLKHMACPSGNYRFLVLYWWQSSVGLDRLPDMLTLGS